MKRADNLWCLNILISRLWFAINVAVAFGRLLVDLGQLLPVVQTDLSSGFQPLTRSRIRDGQVLELIQEREVIRLVQVLDLVCGLLVLRSRFLGLIEWS